jgi:hypothetical protein
MNENPTYRIGLRERLSRQAIEVISNFGKRPYLLETEEQFTPGGRQTAVMILGLDSWIRETFERGTRVWTLAKYGITSVSSFVIRGLSLGAHAMEGIEFSGEMALADRIGNETLLLAVNDKEKGKAWAGFARARENPLLSDHGRPHERRIERLVEMMVWGVDWLRHGSENIKQWILLPFLFSWIHDMDQSSTLQRNLDNKTKLKAKLMHNAAGAIKAKLLQPFLEKAAGISGEAADRLVAGLTVINLVHDEPEMIQKRLSSTGRAADYRQDPQELFNRWQTGEINPFSLTYGDVMTILRIGKQSGGFIIKDTPNGLEPMMEKIYKKRLRVLSGENDKTLGEIIGFKDQNDEKAFRHVLDICIIADLMDMYIPAGESMLKKFMVQVSRERPLFRNMRNARFLRAIKGKGNVDKEIDSDFRRMVWEIQNTFMVADQTQVGRDPFVREMIKTAAVEGLAVYYEDLPELMAGSFSPALSVYLNRETLLAEKAFRRRGLPKFFAAQQAKTIYGHNPVKAREATIDSLGELGGIFRQACDRLDQEQAEVLRALMIKPKDDNLTLSDARLAIYPEKMQARVRELVMLAAEDMGLGDLLKNVLQDKTRKGAAAYLSYDSLGVGKPKVVHAGVLQ